jgi:hypothetical protein
MSPANNSLGDNPLYRRQKDFRLAQQNEHSWLGWPAVRVNRCKQSLSFVSPSIQLYQACQLILYTSLCHCLAFFFSYHSVSLLEEDPFKSQ